MNQPSLPVYGLKLWLAPRRGPILRTSRHNSWPKNGKLTLSQTITRIWLAAKQKRFLILCQELLFFLFISHEINRLFFFSTPWKLFLVGGARKSCWNYNYTDLMQCKRNRSKKIKHFSHAPNWVEIIHNQRWASKCERERSHILAVSVGVECNWSLTLSKQSFVFTAWYRMLFRFSLSLYSGSKKPEGTRS